jgi:hypothetical protein
VSLGLGNVASAELEDGSCLRRGVGARARRGPARACTGARVARG